MSRYVKAACSMAICATRTKQAHDDGCPTVHARNTLWYPMCAAVDTTYSISPLASRTWIQDPHHGLPAVCLRVRWAPSPDPFITHSLEGWCLS